MAVSQIDLLLSAAALSNGAMLFGASGGLPARVGPETEWTFDIIANSQAICFAANDRDFWVSYANNIRKYNFAGTALVTKSASGAWSLWRQGADNILIGRLSVSGFYNYTESTDTLTAITVASTNRITVPGPVGSDRAWYTLENTNTFEVVASTGAATGRSIVTGGAVQNLVSSAADGVWGLYILQGGVLYKYEDVATVMTIVKTWTPSGVPYSPGGGSGANEFIIDTIGRPLVKTVAGMVERWNLTGGNQGGVAERMLWGAIDIGGMNQFDSGGGNQSTPPFCLSQDGKYLAQLVPNAANTVADNGARIKNLQIQRAEWTVGVTGAAGTVLKDITMFGNLGQNFGVSLGWRNGTTIDHRRAKPYYQRVGIDGARVYPQEFTVPVGGLSLAGASSLLVGVDFDCGFGKLGGAPPYVGGSSGEGPRVWIDDGVAPSSGMVLGGRSRGNLNAKARFRGRISNG